VILRLDGGDPRGQRNAGMRRLEVELGAESIYVRYKRDGAHCAEILTRCGVPDDTGRRIMKDLRQRPRLNGSMSLRKATAILQGLTSYIDFFGDLEITAVISRRPEPDLLPGENLERLLTALRQ
jgi:hypothetical protein